MEFLWRFHSLARSRLLTWCANPVNPLEKPKTKSTMSSSLLMKIFMGFSLRLILFFLVSSQSGALWIYEKRQEQEGEFKVICEEWKFLSGWHQTYRNWVDWVWRARGARKAKIFDMPNSSREDGKVRGDVDDDDENFHAFLNLAKAICLFSFLFYSRLWNKRVRNTRNSCLYYVENFPPSKYPAQWPPTSSPW